MVLFISRNAYCKYFSKGTILSNMFCIKISTIDSIISNVFLFN